VFRNLFVRVFETCKRIFNSVKSIRSKFKAVNNSSSILLISL